MTPPRSDGDRLGRIRPEPRQEETVKPLELFFDLVFVLGFTQCTALMAAQPTWPGIGRGMLALAVLWWAWVGYAWLTSVIDPEEGAIRLAMFAAMAGLLIVALCVPEAFGDRAVPFAVAYAVVRGGHILLYVLASRGDPAMRHSVAGLALSSAIAVSLLFGAAFLDSGWQEALWVLAIVLDFGEPAGHGHGRMDARPGPLRRAPQPGDHPRPRRVDRGPRRRLPVRPHRRRHRRCGARDRAGRRPLVDLLRRRRPRHRASADPGRRRAGSATRWPGTPTRTCTTRWSRGSSSSPSGWSGPWPTSTSPSTTSPGSPSWAGPRSTCWATWRMRLRNAHTLNVQRLGARGRAPGAGAGGDRRGRDRHPRGGQRRPLGDDRLRDLASTTIAATASATAWSPDATRRDGAR